MSRDIHNKYQSILRNSVKKRTSKHWSKLTDTERNYFHAGKYDDATTERLEREAAEHVER